VNEFPGLCERRVELESRWPLRLPCGGVDGVARRRGGVLERLLHVDDRPVLLRAAQSTARTMLIGAWGGSRSACETALARMRFALGVDDDLARARRRCASSLRPTPREAASQRRMRCATRACRDRRAD
jgi:hypothetical protein